MIINHNMAAMNTHRQLGSNNAAAANNIEKLSSGLKINRAGDDAAGLAISEKMRGQIRGLDMASKNAQDSISLIQTAEGALNETHDILQRMRELSVQSANDTNTATDRNEIQKEVDQLSQEISRIGDNTEFNTQKLLNGNFEGKFHIGANENQGLTLDIGDMRGKTLGMAGDVKIEQTATLTGGTDTNIDIADGSYQVKQTKDADTFDLVNKDGIVVATSADADAKVFNVAAGDDDTITFAESVKTGTIEIKTSGSTTTATTTGSVENTGLQAGNYTFNKNSGDAGGTLSDANGNTVAKSTDGMEFKTLDDKTTVATFSAALAADKKFEVGGIDVSSQSAANKATTTIQSAIDKVSAERSKLGATQNRLEHTINNLGTSSENLTAAESRIRDVDMAKEMMDFTKNNILTQAAQAMLSQANQQPQGVLQLLR